LTRKWKGVGGVEIFLVIVRTLAVWRWYEMRTHVWLVVVKYEIHC
jgi:hypothetical protein